MMIDLIGHCIDINKRVDDITRKIIQSSLYYSEKGELLSRIIELSNTLALKQIYIMAILKQEEINNLTKQHERQKLLDDFWKQNNMGSLFFFKLVDIEDLLEEEFSFEDIEQCIQKVIDYNNKFIDLADKLCEEFDTKVCL